MLCCLGVHGVWRALIGLLLVLGAASSSLPLGGGDLGDSELIAADSVVLRAAARAISTIARLQPPVVAAPAVAHLGTPPPAVRRLPRRPSATLAHTRPDTSVSIPIRC